MTAIMLSAYFFYLAKAFDTMDHEILLHELDCYAIKGYTSSYLDHT